MVNGSLMAGRHGWPAACPPHRISRNLPVARIRVTGGPHPGRIYEPTAELVSSLCIVSAKRNPSYPHFRPKSERERTHPILAPGNVHETNSGLSVPRHGLSIERRRE
jgi:hypothetical protein